MRKTNIKCTLVGTDGNALSIIGKVCRALRTGTTEEKGLVGTFMTEAMSGDYNHVLQTAMKYVDVC